MFSRRGLRMSWPHISQIPYVPSAMRRSASSILKMILFCESTWFRLCLSFPLGGNRKGQARAALNRGIVFFLCGLWHGAAWTFVVWGLYQGAFLLLEQYIKPLQNMPHWLGHLYACVVTAVGFVIFRAETLAQAGAVIAQMFTGFSFGFTGVQAMLLQLNPLFIFMFIVGCVGIAPWPDKARAFAKGHGVQVPARAASYAGALALLVICILELSAGGYNPFIYFRF